MLVCAEKYLLIRNGWSHTLGKKEKIPNAEPSIAPGDMYFTHEKQKKIGFTRGLGCCTGWISLKNLI